MYVLGDRVCWHLNRTMSGVVSEPPQERNAAQVNMVYVLWDDGIGSFKAPKGLTQPLSLEREMMETASWVIVSRKTGKAVFETFSRKVADAINLKAYRVVPIGEYLASLNHIA